MHARTDRSLLIWKSLSALLLLAMGGIHLYLVLFGGFDGLVGTLFVLNAIGGLVLAVAILAAPRRFLFLVSVLSLLFMAGTLLGLVLALTPSGFLGVHEQFAAQLVTETLIVESVGVVVLVVTTVLARRSVRSGGSSVR